MDISFESSISTQQSSSDSLTATASEFEADCVNSFGTPECPGPKDLSQSSISKQQSSSDALTATASEIEADCATNFGAPACPGPKDLSQTKDCPPSQPILEKTGYTYRIYSDRRRNFQSEWFKKFKWLEYSTISHSAFCNACRFFSNSTGIFISSGFDNWKSALSSGNGFQRHEFSALHKKAIIKKNSYEETKLTGTVMSRVDASHALLVEQHKKYLEVLTSLLITIATCGLALRGHDESVDSINKGNFLELVDFCDENFKEFADLQKCLRKNAHYKSPKIQNRILELLRNQVITIRPFK